MRSDQDDENAPRKDQAVLLEAFGGLGATVAL